MGNTRAEHYQRKYKQLLDACEARGQDRTVIDELVNRVDKLSAAFVWQQAQINNQQRQINELVTQVHVLEQHLGGIYDAMNEATASVEQIVEITYARYSMEIEWYRERYGDNNAPVSLVWIQETYKAVEKVMKDYHNETVEQSPKDASDSPYDAMHRAIGNAIRLAQISTARDVSSGMLSIWRVILENPVLVCEEIMVELESAPWKELRIQTVRRLDLNWAKKNIHPQARSHYTLWRALNHAHRSKLSDESRGEYAERIGVSKDTLEKWITYLNKIQQIAEGNSTE